ncbi:neuronal acetylcholine receptor subunit alpha-9-like [Mercenaria mercenaria]|uniref:neuronal acetylcholine receptor subunit alpha-9-like n=1 Tax=Mercenaria mercenaria TaxID=6596 RepID=UPI00234FB364|nr:neuronal acetylcholine receptor subunit alpha-9-like [Mercenaria mercenaria]
MHTIISCKSFLFLLVVHAGMSVECLNVSEANNLYSSLLTDYNKKLLPLTNQTEAAYVGVYVYLLSINTFDEISGELALTLIFNFTWREERMSWVPEEFDGKTSLLIAPEDIWRPKTFIRESFDTLQEIGNGSEMLRITFDGIAVWTLGSVVKVTCPVDVTFFPFDSQTCSITLTTLTVRSEDVTIYTLKASTDTIYWANNSQWSYQNSTVISYAIPNGPTGIIIDITLKRRSEFYIIYIVVPLVFLGGMNNLVFSMPATFGERTSVAITAFLSFAVYMQIVNNNVPQSSSPIAYIYYYLMFLLLYSAYIMFACIVSMRIYDRKGKVPVLTKYLVICLRCMCCKRRQKNGKVAAVDKSKPIIVDCGTDKAVESTPDRSTDYGSDKLIQEQQEHEIEDDEVTWTLVGKTFDTYCSGFNFFVYWTFTGATFLSLFTNANFLKSF